MSSKQAIIDAVDEYFSDTSRPASETRDVLEDVILEIQMKIDSLPEDDEDDGDDE